MTAASESIQKIKVFGTRGSAQAYAIRDFLHRSDVPFEWIELGSSEQDRSRLALEGLDDSRLPACIFPDGTHLECPTIRQITEKLGWFRNPSRSEYDLAIYGAGPAGLSAAVYGASEGLKTVVIERSTVGGQAGSSSKIENYLGFPNGITGADLAEAARKQACKFGAEILMLREGVRGEFFPGKGVGYLADGTKIIARATICATGVNYRKLGLADEERLTGKGVYYGAGSSEAALCKGETVVVVGGGNSAGQAVMHFAPFASQVLMVVRAECLKKTLSEYLIDRIQSTPNIQVLVRTEVDALHGEAGLDTVSVKDIETGEARQIKTRWLFLCLGGVPQTQWAADVGIVRDEQGYLVTGPDLLRQGERPKNWEHTRDPYYMETNIAGLFAAGDVRHGSVKRCASAVGEGAMAVTFVHRYLAKG